jgi:hypothetical protein
MKAEFDVLCFRVVSVLAGEGVTQSKAQGKQYTSPPPCLKQPSQPPRASPRKPSQSLKPSHPRQSSNLSEIMYRNALPPRVTGDQISNLPLWVHHHQTDVGHFETIIQESGWYSTIDSDYSNICRPPCCLTAA